MYNPCSAFAERILSHTEHTRNEFHRMLSIRGTPISSHAEHARKCLKVEYLGRIEYDFHKSRVTGPWDHMVSVAAKKVKKNVHACVPLKSRQNAAKMMTYAYRFTSTGRIRLVYSVLAIGL
jgi:hypothetical protein